MVMQWREATVAALHSRRGTLKSVNLAGGPCLPIPQDLRGKAPGECMRSKRATDNLHGLLHRGFPPGTARTGHLVLPIHLGQQRLLCPRSPETRDSGVLQVLPHPYPPKVHECCQGRDLLFDLPHRRLPIWQLMTVG